MDSVIEIPVSAVCFPKAYSHAKNVEREGRDVRPEKHEGIRHESLLIRPNAFFGKPFISTERLRQLRVDENLEVNLKAFEGLTEELVEGLGLHRA